MITTTYDYSSGAGFLYDSAKIEFSGGAARLVVLDDPLVFTPDISASTYDSAILEYVSGFLRQKDQRPANATYYAAFASVLNANWGAGALTVTAFNGAAIVASKLNLVGLTNKYVTFVATANADSLNTGTVEFRFTPAYSGAPAQTQVLYSVCESQGSANNMLIVENFTNGSLYFQIFDGVGVNLITIAYPWSPVSGTEYTIRVTYSSGSSKLYIDGAEVGTSSVTYSRTGAVAFGTIGVYSHAVGGNANFSIRNLSVYSAVVTPVSPILASTIYVDATANLPLFTYSGLGSVQAFTAFTENDSGTPHYTLNSKYWNGSAWVASNGSYAQSNTKTEVDTNIAALTPSDTLQVNAIYQAQNSPQMSIGVMTVGYTGQAYSVDDPTIAPTAPLTLDSLSSFVADIVAAGSDAVTFFLRIGSTNYWWSGSAWVASDGSFAQSNTAAEVLANAAALPVDDGVYLTPYALLHSDDGMTTPSITSLTIIYDYFGPSPSGPNVCTVFGYILDETKTVVPNARVTVLNPTTFFNQGIVQAQGPTTITTNSEGYFEVTLAETATVAKRLTWSVAYPLTRGTFRFGQTIIPDSPSVNFTDLTFVV